MTIIPINPLQRSVVQSPIQGNIFLEGPAGTGKTTAGIERMLHLMNSGIPGSSILIFVPQRTLGTIYLEAMNSPGVTAGGIPTLVTIGGLAQRMIDLFWPIMVETAGFLRPEAPPTFLTLETAQYFMAKLVKPLLDEGLFGSVTILRNRLYSQIIDNLNKAAIVGFSYLEIGDRLKSAWSGESGQSRVYDDAQHCATLFRKFCLSNNLLDFSLQIEVFCTMFWKLDICKEYLINTYRHLIIDNVEEDVPVTHDLLIEWLPISETALLLFDTNAGYRRFLGADPIGAYKLKKLCTQTIEFNESLVTSPEIDSLSSNLNAALLHKSISAQQTDPPIGFVF